MIIIREPSRTQLVAVDLDTLVMESAPVLTFVPDSDDEVRELLGICIERGWIEDRGKKAETEPTPDTHVTAGHVYINTSTGEKVVVSSDWIDQIGKPLAPWLKHDPVCPQCYPAKVEVNPDARFKVGCYYVSATGLGFRATEEEDGKLVWRDIKHASECPQCHPTPEVNPDTHLKGGCYYTRNTGLRFRATEGQEGTPLWKDIKHDPACPQCHPVQPEAPLKVGERFSVADVQADPALRKQVEGCEVYLNQPFGEVRDHYWMGPGLGWTDNKAHAFGPFPISSLTFDMMVRGLEKNERSEFEIVSLPAMSIAEIAKDVRITPYGATWSAEPQDFKTVFELEHRYIEKLPDGSSTRYRILFMDPRIGKPVGSKVRHDPRCPKCRRDRKRRKGAGP